MNTNTHLNEQIDLILSIFSYCEKWKLRTKEYTQTPVFSFVYFRVGSVSIVRKKAKHTRQCKGSSNHLGNDSVDQFLSVSPGTVSFSEGVSLNLESTKWGRELEWPGEVVCFLELGSTGLDLVDEVLDAVDSVGTEFLSNDAVVSERESSSITLSVSSLVVKL